VFTIDLSRALRFADEIHAGVVKVNQESAGVEFQGPFGGMTGVVADRSSQQRSLLIMAGGRATRLGGVRKTALWVGGRPILERVLVQLGPLAEQRIALVHDADLPALDGLQLLIDVHEYAGPLPALAHGLAAATGDVVLLVAGDMPFVATAVFRYMLRLQLEHNAAVVVPYVDGHIESMHAVFRRRDLLDAIGAAQREGEQRLFKVFESLSPRLIDEAELRALDPHLHTLFNVNSAADLTAAERIAAADITDKKGSGPE
jgi:molybdopterin-guanine dinucleotide biosynthesis protein A